jgi:hypothetical protein
VGINILGKNRILAFTFKTGQKKSCQGTMKDESFPVKYWKRKTFADYPIKGIHQEWER